MRLFGDPYNNDLVICKDSPDYLNFLNFISIFANLSLFFLVNAGEMFEDAVINFRIVILYS